MPKSLKKNFAFNLINSITGLLFPFITFPYASRIMGAAGIGQVNFYNSIISYIILFAGLGIPLYAVREIARVRDDEYKMNKTFLEIFSLHSFLTIIGYIIVLILCFTVPRIHEGLPLFLLLSLSIGFTTIGCEWFYQGIEDFKYITIRGLCFRISAIAILFIFVHSSSDIMWYGALYIKLNIYICINIQHQMWTKTAGALVFQDRALCSVPTSLHPNPDSSLGTDPAFAMMVL